MFFGNLRAQAVHLIVIAGDAYNFRAKNVGSQNFCRLEVRRDKDPGLESLAGSVCGHGIRQVSGGRARHGVEAEGFRLRQSDGNNAIFKT